MTRLAEQAAAEAVLVRLVRLEKPEQLPQVMAVHLLAQATQANP
jgi:hypothetical protein